MQASAWMQPEIIAVGEKTIETFIAENAQLTPFDFFFEDIKRSRTYAPEAEAVLAAAGKPTSQPNQIYVHFS